MPSHSPAKLTSQTSIARAWNVVASPLSLSELNRPHCTMASLCVRGAALFTASSLGAPSTCPRCSLFRTGAKLNPKPLLSSDRGQSVAQPLVCSAAVHISVHETLEPSFPMASSGLMAEGSCRTEDFKHSEGGFWPRCDEGIITSAVDMIDSDEELLDEQDRITGALQIGVVGCRRSASWVCFGGGARPRRKRAWKTTNRRGSFAKARKLVNVIFELPSAKEEIYGALDAFVAWELEFPIIAIKKALKYMAEKENWKRVIQVTKWMLSKGQGKTMGTYTLLLQALDHEGRVEEADALWEKILTEHEDATPRIMFTVVIAMFERHNQPRRLLQVFADMEELEIKPDIVTVERVARTYRSLGLLKRADAIEAKYPPTTWGYRYRKGGKKYRIRIVADGDLTKREKSIQSEVEGEEEVEEEDFDDSDSDNDDEFIYEEGYEEEESVEEKSYLLNSDDVLGHRL